jgi:putative hydrolase of the HAD superfamily
MFYKGIIFDLDNTLYNYDRCHNYALSAIIKYLYENHVNNTIINIENEYNIISKKIKYELYNTAASHNKNIYFKILLEKLNINLYFLDEINSIYWKTFYKHMECFEGVIDFIKWNKQFYSD